MNTDEILPPSVVGNDEINSKNGDFSSNEQNFPIKNENQQTDIKQESNVEESNSINNNSNLSDKNFNPSEKRGPPMHEIVGGSSVRRYLNQHLTHHLLDGLREINKTKPNDPLKALGEFLIKRSDEIKSDPNT